MTLGIAILIQALVVAMHSQATTSVHLYGLSLLVGFFDAFTAPLLYSMMTDIFGGEDVGSAFAMICIAAALAEPAKL